MNDNNSKPYIKGWSKDAQKVIGKYDIMTRYSLKDGKFGYYFHDKHDSIDLTLQMILNKLNYYEKIYIDKSNIINGLNEKNLRLTIENNNYISYLTDNDLMKYIPKIK